MDECCELIVTAPDPAWLARFATDLVNDRLAACAHLSEQIRAIYRWEGQLRNEPEARVRLHTRTALTAAVVDRARARHPHDVPCVIAVPIVAGDPAYLAWVRDNTLAHADDGAG